MNIEYSNKVKADRYSVYFLINSLNDSPFYVGYTLDPYGRYKLHLNKCPTSKIGKLRWKLIQELQAYGANITMLIVATYPYRHQAMKHESKIIKKMLEKDHILNNSMNNCVESYSFHAPSLFKT